MKVMLASQHINQYGGNFKTIAHLAPAAVGFTEMDAGKTATGVRQARRQMGRYRFYTRDLGKHSMEVPVAVRKTVGNDVQSHEVDLLHPTVGMGGVGNDRYMTTVLMRRYGKPLAIVQTHWMAALQNSETGLVNPSVNARARAMESAYVAMEAHIGKLLNKGYEAVVMGDFNYKITHEWQSKPTWELWDHGPQALFSLLNMDWHEARLDYMAISDGLTFRKMTEYLAGTRIKGAGRNESDHDWLLADIRWKGKR